VPLTIKHESDDTLNQYNISIERVLKNNELENIISEYERGNINSHFYLWYKIAFDYEEDGLHGIYDDFVLLAK
jgi:hypothetical protein